MPSRGLLLLLGRCDEKKSTPIDREEVLVVKGEAREKSCMAEGEGLSGFESTCSYMSLNRSKLVGKNISKCPCLTRRVVQCTVVLLYRV